MKLITMRQPSDLVVVLVLDRNKEPIVTLAGDRWHVRRAFFDWLNTDTLSNPIPGASLELLCQNANAFLRERYEYMVFCISMEQPSEETK